MSFVKVRGKSFVLDENEILFSGLGIGTWLNMEHFMLGIPTTDSQIRRTFSNVFGQETAGEFFDRFTLNFVTEDDFKFLKETGINLVRVPFHYHLFLDDQNPSVYKEEGFIYFDRLLAMAAKYQIYVLPDLHAVPGGQNPDWHSDNQTGCPQFWHYKAFRDQMVSLWQAIAKRYKDEPYLLGYDLLNEPFLIPKEDLIDQFYKDVTAAIRSVDTNHILFLEGDFFAMDFSCIHSILDEQTALAFHYYPTVWEPDLFRKDYDRDRRKQEFEKVFQNLIKIRDEFSRPILCGEAGYDIDREDISFTMGLVEDTLELFRKYMVSWTLWCYKDAQFMGVVYPGSDTPWMKFITRIHQYWSHYKDTDMAQETIERLCSDNFVNVVEEDKYILRFRQRAIYYELEAKYWLTEELRKYTKEEILKLPESFLMKNCGFYPEYTEVLKKFSVVGQTKCDIEQNLANDMYTYKSSPLWNEALPLTERLDYLIGELTLDEKIQCLTTKGPEVKRLGIKPFYLGGEAAHGIEARHDQNFNMGTPIETTVFTQPIGMSATWDTNLIEQAGIVTGTEARAIYTIEGNMGLSRWAPTVDMERDPRWGRNEEGYGEDPFLTGKMSSAYIRGLQGTDGFYIRCGATLKHFYANNVEKDRERTSSSIDTRNKKEYYLESFRRTVMEGDAEAIMTSYNEINGIPAIVNPEVWQIVKEEWGLKGHVVCDAGSMGHTVKEHKYTKTDAETIALALKAGLDSFSDPEEIIISAAKEALDKKMITEEDLNRSIRNTFSTKLRLGLFDSGDKCPYNNIGKDRLNCREHKDICLEVAKKGIVLLKNEVHLLPLTRDTKESIAVIGPLADVWYKDWYSGIPESSVTPLEGLRREFEMSNLSFSDGIDRIKLKVGDRYIAVDNEGVCYLTKENNAEIFEHSDWGDNKHTLRAVSLKKFLSSVDESGHIMANREEVFSWYVQEVFSFQGITEEENKEKKFKINSWNGLSIFIDQEGRLCFDGEEKDGCVPAEFTIEVISDGMKQSVELAKSADKVIVAAGCHPIISCKEERDRISLSLPPKQRKLLQEIKKVNPNIILILITNYPYAIDWEKENIPAILTTASGSQELGTAVAKAISGEFSPAGRLNMTWYQEKEELPSLREYDIIHAKRTYWYYDKEALYPFGYGLTYTDFEYRNLEIAKESDHLLIKLLIKNIGSFDSDEVVQLYVNQLNSRTKRPKKQLKGFQRIFIKVGQEISVTFKLPFEELNYYDVVTGRMLLEDSEYQIQLGASSEDIKLDTKLHIDGIKIPSRDMTRMIPCDHYDSYHNLYLHLGHDGMPAMIPGSTNENGQSNDEGIAIYQDASFEFVPKKFVVDMKAEEQGSIKVLYGNKEICTLECWAMDEYNEIEVDILCNEFEIGVRKPLSIMIKGRNRVVAFCFR